MNASHAVDEPAELLAFLFAAHAGTKKNTVRQWLEHGAVSVNGRSTTRFDHPLRRGDVVTIDTAAENRSRRRLPVGLTIRFEDDWLIVVEKPAGMLSVSGEGVREKSAHSHLTQCLQGGNPRGRRAFVVHRLDRATSGLMVFAKSEAAMHAIKNGWPSAEKRYLAVVEGRPPADRGTFDSHLDESSPMRVKSAVQGPQTRRAVTHYRVVRASADRAVVELTLQTGRRNQIRVHLADAGCPVVGDGTYGAKTDPVGRLALHATRLEFDHPATGERLQFESPLPRKLANLVK